jgi:hypothetical protein
MQKRPTHPIDVGVDPEELDRHITQMYRDVANEAVTDLHFTSDRAQRTTEKYGAHSISLLALKPIKETPEV